MIICLDDYGIFTCTFMAATPQILLSQDHSLLIPRLLRREGQTHYPSNNRSNSYNNGMPCRRSAFYSGAPCLYFPIPGSPLLP